METLLLIMPSHCLLARIHYSMTSLKWNVFPYSLNCNSKLIIAGGFWNSNHFFNISPKDFFWVKVRWTEILFNQNHYLAFLLVRFGSLFCWKTHLIGLPPLRKAPWFPEECQCKHHYSVFMVWDGHPLL